MTVGHQLPVSAISTGSPVCRCHSSICSQAASIRAASTPGKVWTESTSTCAAIASSTTPGTPACVP